MPFYLKESDVLAHVARLRSVLIVPCRFCPAASLAVREEKPYIELFRRGLRTGAYESFIQALKQRLDDVEIQTKSSSVPSRRNTGFRSSRRSTKAPHESPIHATSAFDARMATMLSPKSGANSAPQ